MHKKLFFVIIIFLFFGCEDESYNSNLYDESSEGQLKVEEAFKTAKQIFYLLPSPVETAMILENTEVEFSDSYILSLKAVDLYETTTEQALNLGVYSADLAYLTMFNQTQYSIDYMAVCKKLAEDMGIMNVISDSVLNEIQEKIKNRDEVMNIISEQFMEVNAYLEENDRAVSAALIVYGGWIEGLYVSIMLVGDDVQNNPQLVEMIYDQRISLNDLISLVAIYKDIDDMKKFLVELNELKKIYEMMDMPVNQNQFDQLKSKITLMRNSFTKTKY